MPTSPAAKLSVDTRATLEAHAVLDAERQPVPAEVGGAGERRRPRATGAMATRPRRRPPAAAAASAPFRLATTLLRCTRELHLCRRAPWSARVKRAWLIGHSRRGARDTFRSSRAPPPRSRGGPPPANSWICCRRDKRIGEPMTQGDWHSFEATSTHGRRPARSRGRNARRGRRADSAATTCSARRARPVPRRRPTDAVDEGAGRRCEGRSARATGALGSIRSRKRSR